MSESFDRIRPPRERPPIPDDDDGRDARSDRVALFSTSASQPAPALGARCSRCGATTGLDARTALRAAMPLVLIAPWRRAPVFARCPACHRRSWLAIEVGS